MTTNGAAESIVMGVAEDLQAVSDLRRELTDAACGWGLSDLDAMEVVVSELVTNAIRHAKSSPVVRLSRCGPAQVRVEVTDERPEEPLHVATYDNHTHGLGLHIVDALSTAWGVEAGASSKTVWAEIDLDESLEAEPPA